MTRIRTITDFPRNEQGLVDHFLGTAYDVVKEVYLNLNELNLIYEAIEGIDDLIKYAVDIEMGKYTPELEEKLRDTINQLENIKISGEESLNDLKEILSSELSKEFSQNLTDIDLKIKEILSLSRDIILNINSSRVEGIAEIRKISSEYEEKVNALNLEIKENLNSILNLENRIETIYKSMAIFENTKYYLSLEDGIDKEEDGNIFGVYSEEENKLTIYALVDKVNKKVRVIINDVFSSYEYNKIVDALGDSLELSGSKYLNVLNSFSEFKGNNTLLKTAQDNIGITSLNNKIDSLNIGYRNMSIAPIPFFNSSVKTNIIDSMGNSQRYLDRVKLYNTSPVPYFNSRKQLAVINRCGYELNTESNYRHAPLPYFGISFESYEKHDISKEGKLIYNTYSLITLDKISPKAVINSEEISSTVFENKVYNSKGEIRDISGRFINTPTIVKEGLLIGLTDYPYIGNNTVQNSSIFTKDGLDILFPAGKEIMHIFITYGQSNAIGAQGLPLPDKLTKNPFNNLFMLDSVNPNHDVRPIEVFSGVNTVTPFKPEDIIGIRKLVTSRQGNTTRGSTISEGAGFFLANLLAEHKMYPNMLWINAGWGGVTIKSLSEGLLLNNFKLMTEKAVSIVKDLGYTPVFHFIQWNQGESDLNNTDYDEALLNLHEIVTSHMIGLTNQKHVPPMILTQPSSFSNRISMSCLKMQEVSEKYPDKFILSGGNFMFPYASDLLHLTGLGHIMKGETDAVSYIRSRLLHKNNNKQLLKINNIEYIEGNRELRIMFNNPIEIEFKYDYLSDAGIHLEDSKGKITVVNFELINSRTLKLYLSRNVEKGDRKVFIGYNSKYPGSRDDINNMANHGIREKDSLYYSYVNKEKKVMYYLPHTIKGF